MGEIIHIPAVFVKPLPMKPFDPREQAVLLPDEAPSDRAVIRAQAATIAELQAMLRQLTRPPLHVQALKGDLPPNTCCACGCHIPLKPVQTSWPLGVLYGDPHLSVTRAVIQALEDQCGPAVQNFYDTLGNDERLMFGRQLSRVAVSAHLEEMAR